MLLSRFLQSFKKSLPPSYVKLIQLLSKHPNLFIHQPIVAQPAFHPLAMKMRVAPEASPVPKGASLLMLSTAQTFSGGDLIGAQHRDKIQMQNFFQQKSKQFSAMQTEHYRGLIRILIQIFANQQQTRTEMPLHYYSNLFINESYNNPNNPQDSVLYKLGLDIDFSKYKYGKYIKSDHIKQNVASYNNTIKNLHQILSTSMLKTVTFDEFMNVWKLVRAQLREVKQFSNIRMKGQESDQPIMEVVSPVLTAVKSSDDPNCTIVGKYFTHLRQSYFSLESLREIKAGQEITIAHRSRGGYNIDKFLRLGYQSILDDPNNIKNQIFISFDIMNTSIQEARQIMENDIDKKKDILVANDMEMSTFVTIKKNGRIQHKDMKMMRILFGIQDQSQIQSQKDIDVDRKIYNFIGHYAQEWLNFHVNQSNKPDILVEKDIKQDVIKAIRHIEKQDISLIKKFIQVKNQMLGSKLQK